MPPRNSHCKWLSWLGIFAFLQSVGMFWSMHCDLYYRVSLLCPGVISAQERILKTPLASSPRWLPQPSPVLDGSSVSAQHFSLCANTEWTCAQAPYTQDAPPRTHAPPLRHSCPPPRSPHLPPSLIPVSICSQSPGAPADSTAFLLLEPTSASHQP